MAFVFEVRGTNRVANPIRKTAAQFPDISDEVIGGWAKKERAGLKGLPYPPKLPNQKYVRTGELPNRWAAVRVKAGVWRLQNAREGVGYVVGDKQAKIHQGRWYKADAEIGKSVPELRGDLTSRLNEELNP